MAVLVKICGVTDPAAIGAAIEAGASYLGFVFYPPSPRHLHVEDAAMLARGIPPSVRKVGVFVDPDDDLLEQAVRHVPLDVIQLHGNETRDRIIEIRSRFGVEIWKAIKIKTYADLTGLIRYQDVADRILLDSRTPPGSKLPGGMGIRFDWNLIQDIQLPDGWVLSGGLDAANVAEAIRVTGTHMVDVSSGVESGPGRKNPAFIRAFFDAVRSATPKD